MDRKRTRRISWFVILAILASLLALPAAAVETEENEPAGDSFVNIAETTPAADDAEAEEPGQTERPGGTEEPDPSGQPGESDPTEQPAPTEQPDGTDEPDPAELPDGTENDASSELELDGGDPPPEFIVTYMSGGDVISTESVALEESPANVPTQDAAGRSIFGWTDDDGAFVDVAALKVTEAVTLHAWYKPSLNSRDHIRYISGMGNGCFSPTTALTRSAAAMILYMLLDDRSTGPIEKKFSDVPDGAWFAAAVNTLASCGVLSGYPDGTFRPYAEVTRGEFVTMLVNITGITGSSVTFDDVKTPEDHWAGKAILAAASNGWISGMGDGTFRPYNTMTRAQAVIVVNNALGRRADTAAIKAGEHILHYLDVTEGQWWYEAVMEASIGHEFTTSGGAETWTTYNRESTGMTAGLHNIGSCFCYVDSQYNQLVPVKQGINKIDGKFYYAYSDGYSITADLAGTSGAAVLADGRQITIVDGLNMLDSVLFHWNVSGRSASELKQGLNELAVKDEYGNDTTKLYWADEPGYTIRVLSKGPVTLDEKLYLSDGYGVITHGYTYRDGAETSLPSYMDLAGQIYEYDGNMYSFHSDHTLLADEWNGLLYFGANGKYTSGDSQLDGYVWNLIKGFVGNDSISKYQKLFRGYIMIRGGDYLHPEVRPTSSMFRYQGVGSGFYRRQYNSQEILTSFITCARRFYEKRYGMCYEWGSAYMFLARRLGFQAYPIVGGVWESDNVHCWAQIKWSGTWHISDVELEWGHLTGYYAGGSIYRNLFDIPMNGSVGSDGGQLVYRRRISSGSMYAYQNSNTKYTLIYYIIP